MSPCLTADMFESIYLIMHTYSITFNLLFILWATLRSVGYYTRCFSIYDLLSGRLANRLLEKSRNCSFLSDATEPGISTKRLLAQCKLVRLCNWPKLRGRVVKKLLLSVSFSSFVSIQISSGRCLIWLVSRTSIWRRHQWDSVAINCILTVRVHSTLRHVMLYIIQRDTTAVECSLSTRWSRSLWYDGRIYHLPARHFCHHLSNFT